MATGKSLLDLGFQRGGARLAGLTVDQVLKSAGGPEGVNGQILAPESETPATDRIGGAGDDGETSRAEFFLFLREREVERGGEPEPTSLLPSDSALLQPGPTKARRKDLVDAGHARSLLLPARFSALLLSLCSPSSAALARRRTPPARQLQPALQPRPAASIAPRGAARPFPGERNSLVTGAKINPFLFLQPAATQPWPAAKWAAGLG